MTSVALPQPEPGVPSGPGEQQQQQPLSAGDRRNRPEEEALDVDGARAAKQPRHSTEHGTGRRGWDPATTPSAEALSLTRALAVNCAAALGADAPGAASVPSQGDSVPLVLPPPATGPDTQPAAGGAAPGPASPRGTGLVGAVSEDKGCRQTMEDITVIDLDASSSPSRCVRAL